MTLYDALDWCRMNKARVDFNPGTTSVWVRGNNRSYNAPTLEEAVGNAIRGEARWAEVLNTQAIQWLQSSEM